ncbi:NTP transferase domain-containing protein [Citricoccus sp. CH26A]|uniref:NTP transferase domain-containing protein n=1 Tax=Citricoccus TaxID=169133 RepID=UPI0011456F12|nr:NTP transferase domain-containing protein [Citricoccus sp. CH26A]
MSDLTAVILSGGASRRMGTDKASLVLDGVTLLERTAAAVRAAGATRIVVVGDPPAAGPAGGSAPTASVTSALAGAAFLREDPPRSGPVAAMEAALGAVDTSWMLLVPCDLARPAGACRALVDVALGPGRDGAVAVDATGHRQHLTALLDVAALRATARPGITRVRERLAPLDLVEVPEPADSPGLWDDMDTPEDMARVRARRGAAVTDDRDNEVPGLRDWMAAVVTELGLPEDVIVPSPLLDTARDVADAVVRPGAPMSTYLIGVALGLQLAGAGGDTDEDTAQDTAQRVRELAARVQDLASRYDAGPAGAR